MNPPNPPQRGDKSISADYFRQLDFYLKAITPRPSASLRLLSSPAGYTFEAKAGWSGSGSAVKACIVQNPVAGQTVTNSGYATIDFDQILHDPTSMADTSTNRINLPVIGLWFVSSQLKYSLNADSTGARWLEIVLTDPVGVNGPWDSKAADSDLDNGPVPGTYLNCSGLVKVTATTSYISARTLQNSASDKLAIGWTLQAIYLG
jgi:hypothetical protein